MADPGKREAKKAAPTKAQSEMDRYRARQSAGAAPGGASATFGAGPVQWAFVSPPGPGGQGWAMPPSMMPMGAGGPAGAGYPGYYAPGMQGPQDTSVGGRLGSTLGLSV